MKKISIIAAGLLLGTGLVNSWGASDTCDTGFHYCVVGSDCVPNGTDCPSPVSFPALTGSLVILPSGTYFTCVPHSQLNKSKVAMINSNSYNYHMCETVSGVTMKVPNNINNSFKPAKGKVYVIDSLQAFSCEENQDPLVISRSQAKVTYYVCPPKPAQKASEKLPSQK